MTTNPVLTSIFGTALSSSHIDLSALEAKLRLYALQGVAYARIQAINVFNNNLGHLAGPDQEKIAVDKGMELYTVFEGAVPVLAATTLDDTVVREIMQVAVHEAFTLVQTTLATWTAKATTAPAVPATSAVPSVPDSTFPAPVTNVTTAPVSDANTPASQ